MCWKRKTATLQLNKTSGKPDFKVGGLLVHIKATGPRGGILDCGDGEVFALPVSGNHLYQNCGRYRVRVLNKKGSLLRDQNVRVLANPPVLYCPFVAGSLDLLGPVIIDANRQVHGCGGEDRKYGAWPRSEERLEFRLEAKLDDLLVWCEESKARCYLGVEDPPPIPTDMVVMTPQGTWHPGDTPGTPQPSCEMPGVTKMLVRVRVVNQFGCIIDRSWFFQLGQSGEDQYPPCCG